MRIGLFTDTYHPALNGVVYVVDIMREQLEAAGHEVYVFCPEIYIGRNGERRVKEESDPHVIRFPAIESRFFDYAGVSVFFPPREVKRIKDMELDVLVFLTPGQIGLMAAYAAKKLDLPLIVQHSTDVYEYAEHYPSMLPVLVAFAATLPFAVKMKGAEGRDLLRAFIPKRKLSDWGKKVVERIITVLYQKCDAAVVLSRKSYQQISSWEGGDKINFAIIPTGVDPLPRASQDEIKAFRAEHGIKDGDKVMLYAGRLSSEKNLEILIPTTEKVIKRQPYTKLVFVGDFEYREVLEEKWVNDSAARDNIIFAGRLPRDKLGVAYGASDVFVFPSLKDTQGLVLAEAVLAGVPVVMVDEPVTEVVRDGENGIIAENSSDSISEAVLKLLGDDKLRRDMSVRGVRIAREFSEAKQTQEFIELCEKVVESRSQRITL